MACDETNSGRQVGSEVGGGGIVITSAASEPVVAFYIFICLKGVALKDEFTGN